jgi:hypothetical protein
MSFQRQFQRRVVEEFLLLQIIQICNGITACLHAQAFVATLFEIILSAISFSKTKKGAAMIAAPFECLLEFRLAYRPATSGSAPLFPPAPPVAMCPAVAGTRVSTLVVAAVEEVDAQPDGEPGEQAPPVGGGEREHQEHAGDHPQDGDHRDHGAAEGARVVGVALAHDEHGGADDPVKAYDVELG